MKFYFPFRIRFRRKVSRDNANLERKYQQLLRQNGTLQAQMQEKTEKLEKMRTGKKWCNSNILYISCI